MFVTRVHSYDTMTVSPPAHHCSSRGSVVARRLLRSLGRDVEKAGAMSTIRLAKRKRYTSVDQRTIRDERLSFRARGILIWILDHPDDWAARSENIASAGKEGRDAVRAALRELEECGYLAREKWRDERGRWHSDVWVYEQPMSDWATNGFPGVGEPVVGESGASRKTETND